MLFRRIILASLLVGLLSGLLLSVGQHLQVNPIIRAAEQFESTPASDGHHHGHGSSDHSHGTPWSPKDGAERLFFTALSNVLAGIGFAALMLAAMATAQLYGRHPVTFKKGPFWGLAGFACFFAGPAMGMPPEIPGINAAPLEHRQGWWFLTVATTMAGLAVLVFLRGWRKLPGLILLAIPFIAGAPHPAESGFSHPDPQAVASLEQLHSQFVVASTVTNAFFWLLLGTGCGWLAQRWVLKDVDANQ